MLKKEYFRLLYKYKILEAEVGKEVIVDEELLEEFAKEGEVYFPYAFPGFIFRYVGGRAWDDTEKKRRAVEEEYNVVLSEEFTGENLFVEVPPKVAREVIEKGLKKGFNKIYGVIRESVGIGLIAEPGWREYGPISVFLALGYEVDAYRLEADLFHPHPKGPMAGFKIVKKRGIEPEFMDFLKSIFAEKRKKVEQGKRPFEMDPEELYSLFETTKK